MPSEHAAKLGDCHLGSTSEGPGILAPEWVGSGNPAGGGAEGLQALQGTQTARRNLRAVIAYQLDLEGVTPDKLTGFFVGWSSPPTAAEHLAMLKGSSHVVLATDEDQVVGFIAAHSDGVISAYISLLEVLPSHQDRAMGSELVTRMLAMLDGLYMVDLLCDRELEAFYSRFGMKPSFGMMVRNHQWRSNRV